MSKQLFEYKDFKNWYRKFANSLNLKVGSRFTKVQIDDFLFTLRTILKEDKDILATEPVHEIKNLFRRTWADIKYISPELYPADEKIRESIFELAKKEWEKVEAQYLGEAIDPVKETKEHLKSITDTVLGFSGEAEKPEIDTRIGEEFFNSRLRK